MNNELQHADWINAEKSTENPLFTTAGKFTGTTCTVVEEVVDVKGADQSIESPATGGSVVCAPRYCSHFNFTLKVHQNQFVGII